MAQLIGNPWGDPAGDRLGPKFEAEVRELLRTSLPKSYALLHSAVLSAAPRKLYGKSRRPRPREVDFVVAGPNGLFLVEAKCKEIVEGHVFGPWVYRRAHGGRVVAQSWFGERPGRDMRVKISQAATHVQQTGGREFHAYRQARAIFVFPDGADIRITDDAGEVRPQHLEQFWIAHLSELADLIKSIPRSWLADGKNRAPRLTGVQAAALVQLFDPAATPHPTVAGDYTILDRSGVRKASNGLPYVLYELRHNQLGSKRRGKWYDMAAIGGKDRDRFEEQVRRHAKVLDAVGIHPNIPKFYEFHTDMVTNGCWVLEEWIDGETLESLHTAGDLGVQDSIEIMRQVAFGLQALHEQNLIRRELSPGSIIIEGATKRAILTDFELVKLSDDSPTVSLDEPWPADPYVAPEIVRGTLRPRVQADLYGWAAVLFHLLCDSPYGKDTSLTILHGRVADSLVSLLASCLSESWEERPDSVKDVLAIIDAGSP